MDLVIPIETKVRELHAKLYLALIAAEQGFRVCFGDARMIRRHIGWLPVGAYFLDKSVVPNRAKLFRYYRAVGLRIVAWCEEGFSLVDPDAYIRHRINPDAMAQTEMFFTWGPAQASIIKERYPELRSRIAETGNPRIDILRAPTRDVFADDVTALRQTYPAMILLNTNFSLCNHKKGRMAYMALLKSGGKISSEEDEAFAKGWIQHKQRLFDAFRELVPLLSRAFPKRTVVVRPHPSENHEFYREEFASLPNVQVVFKGNVVPWLMAADVLVHNGCTTAVEASLLDRPVIAYRPFVSERYDITFPNEVSVEASTADAVVALISGGVSESRDMKQRRDDALREHIHDVPKSHADDIVRRLHDNWPQGHVYSFHERVIIEARRLAFRLRMRLERPACNRDASYEQQKFGELCMSEVEDVVRKFASQREPHVNYCIEQLWENCFVMSRNDHPRGPHQGDAAERKNRLSSSGRNVAIL